MTEMSRNDTVGAGRDHIESRPNPSDVVFRRVAWVSTLVVIAIGALDIIGTILNITLLTSVAPQWIRMRIITAVCFVLGGFELALLLKRPSSVRRHLSLQAPAILIGLAGFLTIWLYAIRMIAGQESSLGNGPFFHIFWDTETRIALLTAVIFFLLGCGLTVLARGSRRSANIAHAIVLPAAIAGYFVPVSYLLREENIHNLLGVPVAVNTGLAFCLLCTGILCARTDTWLMSIFAAGGVGGYMARRLLPAILLIPAVVACVHEYGEQSGAYGPDVVPVLVAVLSTILLLWLVWLSARSINRTDMDAQLPASYSGSSQVNAGDRGSGRLIKYVYALLAVPLAILLRLALMPLLGPGVQYITIYAVTASVAVLGGLGPALVTGLLGAILTDYFFIEPLYALDITVPFISRTAVVVLTSAFVGYVGDMLRAARGKAESHAEILRESEIKYRTVADNTYDWEFWLDPQGRLLYSSPSCLQITGYSHEEFKNDPELRSRLIHPDDRELFEKHLHDVEDKRAIGNGEWRFVRPDGSERWMSHVCRPIFSEEGRYLGVRGSNRDITKRRHVEEALRIASSRAQILSETASQLLQSRQPQEAVNALCRKIMEHLDCHIFVNYLVDEAVHRLRLNASAGLPDQMAEAIKWLEFGEAICGRVAQGGKRIVAENIQESCDRRADLVRSVGIRAYACHPIMTQERVIGTLSFGTRSRPTFTDDDLALMKTVTDQVATAMERMQAQEALKRANEELERRVQERTSDLSTEVAERRRAEAAVKAERQRLYDVMETLPVYVALLTQDYHMPYANRFFRERFGESGGKRCYEFLFNRTEPCEICETYTVLKTGQPHHWEWTGPDGRDYDIYDFPFIDSDGSRLIMEMGIDITEQKRAQKAMVEFLGRQKFLLEASERVMKQTDLDGLLRTISDEARELCGARYVIAGHGYVNGNFITGGASRAPGAMPCPSGQVLGIEKGGVYMDLIEKGESTRLTDAQMRVHPAWWGL